MSLRNKLLLSISTFALSLCSLAITWGSSFVVRYTDPEKKGTVTEIPPGEDGTDHKAIIIVLEDGSTIVIPNSRLQ